MRCAQRDGGPEQPVLASIPRLGGNDARGALDHFGRPACGQREGTWHDDRFAATGSGGIEQGNAQAGFFDGHALESGKLGGRAGTHETAQLAPAELVAHAIDCIGIGWIGCAFERQLPDLLLHRHDGEQVFDETLAFGGVIGGAACHGRSVSHK